MIKCVFEGAIDVLLKTKQENTLKEHTSACHELRRGRKQHNTGQLLLATWVPTKQASSDLKALLYENKST